MWQLPHGNNLLATPKNSSNYCLLCKQPSPARFHSFTQYLALIFLSSSSHTSSHLRGTFPNSSGQLPISILFIAANDFWQGITLCTLSTPLEVPLHLGQRCSTHLQETSQGLTTLLAVLLITDADPFLTT